MLPLRTLCPALASLLAMSAMALGCSDGSTSDGAPGPIGDNDAGQTGAGGQVATGPGGDGGEAVVGPDGGTSGSACVAGDLVAQMQCGAGLACDVERHVMTFASSGTDAGTGGGGGGGGGMDAGGMSVADSGGGGGTGTGVGNETLICRKATTAGTEGAACNASDPTSCAAGCSCGESAGSSDPVCYKFCDDDTSCKSPGGWCHAGPLQTGASEGFTAKTCTLDCDPMKQTGCGTGQSCNLGITPSRTRIYTDCLAAGAGGYQAPCSVAEDCMAGFSCLHVAVNGGSTRQMCLLLCTVSPASMCPSGQTCQAIPPPNTLGSGTTQYGWCY
jgi:hypothetical protein